MNWQKIDLNTPQNVELNTKIDDANGIRNEQTMVLKGNLWWFPDGSMYSYYSPTHWSW